MRADYPAPSVDESTSPWLTTATELRYENPWIQVNHHTVTDPGGRPGVYGVVSPRNHALGALPIHSDGTVTLVGQYRYALDEYSWEMPEGGGPKGASREEAIARELREETGLHAAKWLPVIVRASLSNSVTDERVWCWAAWELTTGDAELESTESDLVPWRMPFADAVTMVWDHRIHDALTIMTLTRLEAMRLRNELPADLQELLA